LWLLGIGRRGLKRSRTSTRAVGLSVAEFERFRAQNVLLKKLGLKVRIFILGV